MSRPRTEAEKNRAKDKRLQEKYGITLAERDARAAGQDHKCKICAGPLDAHGHPCVDHFHFKVKTFRHIPGHEPEPGAKWYGQAYDEKRNVICVRHARTKKAAHAETKKVMLRWAVRGLLCVKCNYGLGCVERFFDAAAHPENLLPVIEYLRARIKNA
jgi:recombination endonuclease VII